MQEILRIEVPVEHIDAVRGHFYLVFSEGANKDYPVTGHMEFFPKRLSAKISKKKRSANGPARKISGVLVWNILPFGAPTTLI